MTDQEARMLQMELLWDVWDETPGMAWIVEEIAVISREYARDHRGQDYSVMPPCSFRGVVPKNWRRA